MKNSMRKFLVGLTLFATTTTAMAMSKIKAMEQIAGGPLHVTLSKKSGLATFLATKPGKEIPIPGLAFGNATERARNFLKHYGETFGLYDPSEYRIIQDHGPDAS